MAEIILLFCILCNFFSYWMIPAITGRERDENVFNTASYDTINECYNEMIVVFVALCIAVLFVRKFIKIPDTKIETNYPTTKEFRRIITFIYLFLVLFTLYNTNWSLNTENRGAQQFQLSGRATLVDAVSGVFFIPTMLYIYMLRIFGEKTLKYVIAGVAVFAFHGIASGGRSNIVSAIIQFSIFFYYIQKIEKKYFTYIILIGIIAFSFSARDRFGDSGDGFLMTNLVKILQVNGNSWFLPMIKKTMAMGTELSSWTFILHFLTIFVPSFIWVQMGHISYTRSTFVFNSIYNTSQSGLGFMMLADFYWCFGYLGYLLYVIVFVYVIIFFRKHIKSSKPYLCIGTVNMFYWYCNQRTDFGAFLKPFVYTIIFLWILEYIRKKSLMAANKVPSKKL